MSGHGFAGPRLRRSGFCADSCQGTQTVTRLRDTNRYEPGPSLGTPEATSLPSLSSWGAGTLVHLRNTLVSGWFLRLKGPTCVRARHTRLLLARCHPYPTRVAAFWTKPGCYESCERKPMLHIDFYTFVTRPLTPPTLCHALPCTPHRELLMLDHGLHHLELNRRREFVGNLRGLLPVCFAPVSVQEIAQR